MHDDLELDAAADLAADADEPPQRERSKIDYSARSAAWQKRLRIEVERSKDFGRFGPWPEGGVTC